MVKSEIILGLHLRVICMTLCGSEDGRIYSPIKVFECIQYTQSAVPASAIKIIRKKLPVMFSVCFKAHSPTSAQKDLRHRNWQLQCG